MARNDRLARPVDQRGSAVPVVGFADEHGVVGCPGGADAEIGGNFGLRNNDIIGGESALEDEGEVVCADILVDDERTHASLRKRGGLLSVGTARCREHIPRRGEPVAIDVLVIVGDVVFDFPSGVGSAFGRGRIAVPGRARPPVGGVGMVRIGAGIDKDEGVNPRRPRPRARGLRLYR